MADQGAPRPKSGVGAGIVEFRLWGRFTARRPSDGVDVAPRGRKPRALLAFLLLDQGPVARERLAALLWSERGQAQAFASLRQALVELRDFAPLLRTDRQQVGIDPLLVRTDLEEIRAALDSGDAGILADRLTGGAALLDGLDGIDPAFDDWLRTVRSSRGDAMIDQARGCGERALERGEIEPAGRLGRMLLEIDPLDEGAARLAMRVADFSGKHDSVERIYAGLVDRLSDQLGVSPSPETVALRDALLAGSVAAGREPDTPPAAQAGLPTSDARKATFRWKGWPVAAALGLLILLSLLVALALAGRLGGAREPPSLAVLPFRNLSSGDDHFAEGVAEEILSQLAREPQLRVAGRTSSWMFDDPGADLRDVGRRLDVSHILEGAVRRDGRRIRVDVALVDTSEGMRLWSHSFHGSLDDIFAIQRAIGAQVVERLRIELVYAAPVRGGRATSGEVYSLYLRARGLIRSRRPAQVREAVGLLEQAVRLDPSYAPAWARLGAAKALAMSGEPDEAGFERVGREARTHLERALALAPELAEAHFGLTLLDERGPGTRERLERAVRLEPANAEYWYVLARVRGLDLDFEGQLEALRRVAAIDPFWIRAGAYPSAAWEMGETGEALRFERRMIRDHPEPRQRIVAALRLAAYRRDWSQAYRMMRRFEGTAAPGENVEAGTFIVNDIFVRLRVGRVDEALALFQLPTVIDMLSGAMPSAERIRQLVRSPLGYWEADPLKHILSLRLIQDGRSAEVVAFYDGAFMRPEEMMSDHPHGLPAFVEDAPYVVVALRDVSRAAEASRLLALADARVSPILAQGRAPFRFLEWAARIRALQGRRQEALALLERAVANGWQHDHFGAWQPLAESPVYRDLRNEPRLRRLDAAIERSLERERMEARSITI